MSSTLMSSNSEFLQSTVEKLVDKGKREAENLYKPIVELEAENTTPIIPGGPYTYTVYTMNNKAEWESIRPTSLRGVWRWWIRALLAGILWEKGVRDYDYQKLAVIESKFLGLGAVGGGNVETEATKLILEIENVNVQKTPIKIESFEIPANYTRNGKPDTKTILEDYAKNIPNVRYEETPWRVLLSIPRYALYCTGKNTIQTKTELYKRQPMPPNSLKLSITLRERVSSSPPKRIALAIGSAALILALAWGGIGQATTRGFGKLGKISIKKDEYGVAKEVLETISKLDIAPTRLVNRILEIIIEKIPKAELTELLEQIGLAASVSETLPRTPTLHPQTVMIEIVRKPKVKAGRNAYRAIDVWSAIVAIGRACLKLEWKALAGMNIKASGRELHTWPLGLPRYVRRTGYAFKKNREIEQGRLASLVRFVPITLDENDALVLVYAFKTADLEQARRELYHLSRRGHTPVRRLWVLDPTAKSMIRPWKLDATKYLNIAFRTVIKILS